VGLGEQQLVLVEGEVGNPPRAGRDVGDLGVGLERRHDHVIGRHEEEDREQDEEHVGRDQRPAPVAREARLGSAGRSTLRDRRGGHPISLPRLRTPRRMKIAPIARSGNMNSDTEAPSGMSPDLMPSMNAEVANTGGMLRGPPAVMICTMSKLAKVTMVENSIVMAMMLRIVGSVMWTKRCQALAPSMAAAS